MSRSLKTFVEMVLLIFACQACGLHSTKPYFNVEYVERLISEQVPVQAQTSFITNFLESLKSTHKVEYSGPWTGPEKNSDFQSPKLDGKRDSVKSYVVAIARDVKREGLTSWDIQMYFYFDENSKLVEHTVSYVGTSM